MKFKTAVVATVLAVGFATSGCSTPSPVTTNYTPVPAVTVTKTVTPVAPEEPKPAATQGKNPELQKQALDIAWLRMTEPDKTSICYGWQHELQRPALLQAVMKGNEDTFDPSLVSSFFDSKCLSASS